MFAVAISLVLLSIITIIVYNKWLNNAKRRKDGKSILIIVLGDLGRSPRMQYHASSFAKEGFQVDLVGFHHSPLIKTLQDHSLVKVVPLNEPPIKPNWLPRLLYYVLKTLFLFVYLCKVVFTKTSKHSHVLVQNPPAIPTLAVAWLICLLRQSNFIIDWHNYGYTILSLAVGHKHPLVTFSRHYEGFIGCHAMHNICVTQAMRDDLQKRWGIHATTLYDRPPDRFQSVTVSKRHEIFKKLSQSYDCFQSNENENISGTRFTDSKDNTAMLKLNRPALLISSTSWTEDEDFGILLTALKQYNQSANEKTAKLPKLVCVITGKGPMKSYYQDIILQTSLDHIEICTPWLEAEDYPILIGSADLGICLHTSSSGLDLPMKVVDMFGCGVPVCAVGFTCLGELVKHGENGLIFNSPTQLAEQLQELLKGFPSRQGTLQTFRDNLKEFEKKRWDRCWKETFFDPMFK